MNNNFEFIIFITIMTKYHFITFATPDHMSFAEENVKSALSVGGFDTEKIHILWS